MVHGCAKPRLARHASQYGPDPPTTEMHSTWLRDEDADESSLPDPPVKKERNKKICLLIILTIINLIFNKISPFYKPNKIVIDH